MADCKWCGNSNVPPPDGSFDSVAWELCASCRRKFWDQANQRRKQLEEQNEERALKRKKHIDEQAKQKEENKTEC